jgi:hypothetical protein
MKVSAGALARLQLAESCALATRVVEGGLVATVQSVPTVDQSVATQELWLAKAMDTAAMMITRRTRCDDSTVFRILRSSR